MVPELPVIGLVGEMGEVGVVRVEGEIGEVGVHHSGVASCYANQPATALLRVEIGRACKRSHASYVW